MLFAALLAVASCSRTDDARLAVAERQMAEHPDSALLTLRQIDASSLNRHNTALYALLLTQAQYKNDITATSDSLINIALDYFSDGKRHIECLIYKGAVLQELGEEQEAIDYLKKAEAATSPTDNEMLGYINMRLGNIYMNSYIENNEDIAKYKKLCITTSCRAIKSISWHVLAPSALYIARRIWTAHITISTLL